MLPLCPREQMVSVARGPVPLRAGNPAVYRYRLRFPHKYLVHEIAWQASPSAKTLYVDYDALVIKRMNNAVDAVDPEHRRLRVVQADMREIDVILESEETRTLIDFTEPVGLLVVATLPFLGPGDDAAGLMARYRHALPVGSYFAASQGTQDGVPDNVLKQCKKVEQLYASSKNPFYYRNRSQFQELFDGWNLVDPGIVWLPEWRAENEPSVDGPGTAALAGVGKK